MSDNFKSVKQNGPVWQPTHTGSKKGNDLVHLEANEKSFIQGYYLGCQTGQGPDQDSTIHKLKVTGVGDKKHLVGEMEKGQEEFSIWGTTVLNDNLSKVGIGKMTRIVWLGKKAPKKGSNHYHDWDVLVDETVEPYAGPGVVTASAQAPVSETPAQSPVLEESPAEDDDLPF